MVKTVRLDKKENYLINTKTGNIVERYNPDDNNDLELVISLENSRLRIDGSMIKTEYGGQVVVLYNDDKFIIDDGYQDILIKAGYIVYKDYDTRKESTKSAGMSLRAYIIDDIINNLSLIGEKYRLSDPVITYNGNEITATIDTENHVYTIIVNTIDDIVTKNNRRKENSLSFYPFDKNMDKYGSVYLSIFAQKKSKEKDRNTKYKIASSFIAELISLLGIDDYHYISQDIKRRIINWNKM